MVTSASAHATTSTSTSSATRTALYRTSTTTATTNNTPTIAATNSTTTPSTRNKRDCRMVDALLDEKDHDRCTQANQASLLRETLVHLQENLTKQVQEEDWMFVKTKPMSTATKRR